jgi:hypothetical protein
MHWACSRIVRARHRGHQGLPACRTAFESTRLCAKLGVGHQGSEPRLHAKIIAIGLRSGRIELPNQLQWLRDCLHVDGHQQSPCQTVEQLD